MPIPSPFHPRTSALCTSHRWKDWAGYLAPASYDSSHDLEYFAFRESAGLIDVSPLYKYEVRGRDAAALLSRMMTRDVRRLKVGRVAYGCWCDDDGKVVDDGTVARLDEEHYRLTAADPTLHWLEDLAVGYEVTLEDSSSALAAVALQGPTSRRILEACTRTDLGDLRFFGVTRTGLGDLDVWITRTGYTGDLGYEVWVESDRAIALWDTLMEIGRDWGILPAGLDALDMARIEAGFVMLHVDYFSSTKVVLESRKSTPFELGLGWSVHLDREPFIGQAALRAERARGSRWSFVGLEASWEELEALYDSYGLPPSLPAAASREALPIYCQGRQVGQVTSQTWSPILKKAISLASVEPEYARPGTLLDLEHTVEFERRTVSAMVVPTPFFDPPRKRG